MNKKIFISILSFLMIFVFITTGCNPPAKKAEKTPLEKTWIETVNGDTIRLKELSGKVVLIDFWATWCPPCRKSIPFLVELYNKYKDEGLTVIGVNVNEKYQDMKNFIENQNITYIVGFHNNDLQEVYQISGIPTFVIFDKKGNLVKTQVGYDQDLDKELEKIIEEELKK